MTTQPIREEIDATLQSLKTVDCHSHTRSKEQYYEDGPFDLFTLTGYFHREVTSFYGEPAFEGVQGDQPRWNQLKIAYQNASNVSYARHHLIVYQELFGFEEDLVTDDNWEDLNATIRRQTADPGWYDHVTDRCQLETQVRNMPWFEPCGDPLFTPILRMESALYLHESAPRAQLEQHVGMSITSLAAARDALRALTQEYVGQGTIGLKLAHAYDRTIHSAPVEPSHADGIFQRALRGESLEAADVKSLQDFLVFDLAAIAKERDLLFQIHTGVQKMWGDIPGSNPMHLLPLLKAFPEVRFDLLHAGYPYARQLGMIAKHYPNVWLNMAWMYIIGMGASRQILSEWLDLVPVHRLLAFGSDVLVPEMVFGHLLMARHCVADALVEKVQRDLMSAREAISMARRMFRDNGIELYRLNP